MVKHYTNFNINKIHRGSIILIGNFDGLHLGHQKLFQLAQSYKKKYNLKIGVVNFDPMPKMFFNKKLKNFEQFCLVLGRLLRVLAFSFFLKVHLKQLLLFHED